MPPAIGREAPTNERLDEANRLGSDDEVTRKGDVGPDPTRNAAHHGDDGQLDGEESGNQAVGLPRDSPLDIPDSGLHLRSRIHFSQIRTGAEMIALRFQYDDAKLRIVDGVLHVMEQAGHHRPGESVSTLRAVEANPQYSVVTRNS